MAIYPRTLAFRKWLAEARPGQIYPYYQGFLAVDRGMYILIRDNENNKTPFFIPNPEITALAEAVIEAWQANRVHLFQRKLHDFEYEYIAMKRSPHQIALWQPGGNLEVIDD